MIATSASSSGISQGRIATVVRSTDSTGKVLEQQFDALSRVVRQVGDGLETWTRYDGVGNVISTRDTSGGTGTRSYDAHACRLPVDPLFAPTSAARTTSPLRDLRVTSALTPAKSF